MEIKWHGNKCFSVKGKGITLLLDPDKSVSVKGDVVLTDLEPENTSAAEATNFFDWPGEYEVKGIPIIGYPVWTKSKTKEQEGEKGAPAIIFAFEIEGVRVCHLGGLGHILSSELVKTIGDVDVLMIDLGPGSNLDDRKSREVIEAIDPKVLIPMGSGEFQKALKDLGAGELSPQDSFEVKKPEDLPVDKRIYIVLNKA